MSKWRYFVSKNKSYMNTNNIISEGMLDTILKAIIPKDVQDKVTKTYVKKQEKKLNDLKKKKKKLDTELESIVNELGKDLHKRYPDSFDKSGNVIKNKINKKME